MQRQGFAAGKPRGASRCLSLGRTGRPSVQASYSGSDSAEHRHNLQQPQGWQSSLAAYRFPTSANKGQDWRAFRAQLVAWERHAAALSNSYAGQTDRASRLQRPPYPKLIAGDSWAHTLAEPEVGCLLLGRTEGMDFFNQSVVLITSHDDAVGSIGYVLNKPSPLLVDELQVLGAAAGFKAAFGSQRLQLGGPVHLDHVTLLHRFAGLARASKVTDGIFMGGLPDAIQMVNSGLARPADFQLVLGMSGWAAGQLRAEVAAGCWHVVAASPDLVLPTPSTPCVLSAHAEESGEESLRVEAVAEEGSVEAAADGRAADVVKSRCAGMYRRIARLAIRGA